MLYVAILCVTIVIISFIIFNYNNLIRLNNRVEESFSGIDIQLKKRYDLIPNLVSAVKAYMVHEKSLLEEITALRSRVIRGDMSQSELMKAESLSRDLLRSIMIAVENYPDLKSNTNVNDLQRNLNEIESQLSAARRTYNAMVRNLNDAVGMFPSSIFAHFMRIEARNYIEIPDYESKNPDVGSLFGAQ